MKFVRKPVKQQPGLEPCPCKVLPLECSGECSGDGSQCSTPLAPECSGDGSQRITLLECSGDGSQCSTLLECSGDGSQCSTPLAPGIRDVFIL